MAEIEHTISDDENAEVELSDEFGHGFYLRFLGNGTAIKIYLEVDQLQSIYQQLTDFGFVAVAPLKE